MRACPQIADSVWGGLLIWGINNDHGWVISEHPGKLMLRVKPSLVASEKFLNFAMSSYVENAHPLVAFVRPNTMATASASSLCLPAWVCTSIDDRKQL